MKRKDRHYCAYDTLSLWVIQIIITVWVLTVLTLRLTLDFSAPYNVDRMLLYQRPWNTMMHPSICNPDSLNFRNILPVLQQTSKDAEWYCFGIKNSLRELCPCLPDVFPYYHKVLEKYDIYTQWVLLSCNAFKTSSVACVTRSGTNFSPNCLRSLSLDAIWAEDVISKEPV